MLKSLTLLFSKKVSAFSLAVLLLERICCRRAERSIFFMANQESKKSEPLSKAKWATPWVRPSHPAHYWQKGNLANRMSAYRCRKQNQVITYRLIKPTTVTTPGSGPVQSCFARVRPPLDLQDCCQCVSVTSSSTGLQRCAVKVQPQHQSEGASWDNVNCRTVGLAFIKISRPHLHKPRQVLVLSFAAVPQCL